MYLAPICVDGTTPDHLRGQQRPQTALRTHCSNTPPHTDIDKVQRGRRRKRRADIGLGDFKLARKIFAYNPVRDRGSDTVNSILVQINRTRNDMKIHCRNYIYRGVAGICTIDKV
jgi:hypothetical protein